MDTTKEMVAYQNKCKCCGELFWTSVIEDLCYECIAKENAPKWERIWDAPDGTFKGRCDKCGFVKIFIDGHDTQYKFCPQCGDRK